MKLILATKNKDKVKEIRALLEDLDIEVLSATDFPELPDVLEDGSSLEENAVKKAKVIHQQTGYFALADDTGLEVDALDGKPGVFSSRFAGENASYSENVTKLLQLLKNIDDSQRTARFRTVAAFVGDGILETFEGVCEGMIIRERRGDKGFGYDPVFFVPEVGLTFAEMDAAQKNLISHRGKALQKFKDFLREFLKTRGA